MFRTQSARPPLRQDLVAVADRQCRGVPRLRAIATAATAFRPLIREPVFVLRATAAELARTHQRGITRNPRVAIHTAPLFKTTDDVANRNEVAAYEPKRLIALGSASTPTTRPSTRRSGGRNFFG